MHKHIAIIGAIAISANAALPLRLSDMPSEGICLEGEESL